MKKKHPTSARSAGCARKRSKTGAPPERSIGPLRAIAEALEAAIRLSETALENAIKYKDGRLIREWCATLKRLRKHRSAIRRRASAARNDPNSATTD
jgi:hypothetical protein